MFDEHLKFQGKGLHPMTVFHKDSRMPLERAIEVVEEALSPHDMVFRTELHAMCKVSAPEAQSLLDHTLQVMIHGGYVRRVIMGPNQLAYAKTEHWSDRDDTLCLLRAPRYKKRHRPRSHGRRIYPVAPTVEKAALKFAEFPVQAKLFGGAA